METTTRHDDGSTAFELTSFLQGRSVATGIFEDRFGRLRRRFRVEMFGHWRGEVFHLDERFEYDTGEVEARTWLVTPLGAGRFTATCPDCVGKAYGESSSDSIRMAYKFRLRVGTRSFVLAFDDRIYRMADGAALNRVRLKKWGFKIGELSLHIQRANGDGQLALQPVAASVDT